MPDPRIWPIPLVRDTFATVGLVSILVVAANPDRVDLELVNDSDGVIYLARGNAAAIGHGIRLNANGGSYGFGTEKLFLGDINAIGVDGQQNLTISEGAKV